MLAQCIKIGKEDEPIQSEIKIDSDTSGLFHQHRSKLLSPTTLKPYQSDIFILTYLNWRNKNWSFVT